MVPQARNCLRAWQRLLLACFLTSVLLPAVAGAQEEFVVRDMRVEGLQRISEGTVFNYLPINIGDTVGGQRIQEAIRALYGQGLFEDIEMRRDGDTLIIAVRERPSIEQFTIEGNKDIKTEDLMESLRNVGLARGRTFDRSVLDNVQQFLREQYYDRGKYAVQVDAKVEETARGYGCEQVGIGQQTENEVSLRAVYKCVALVMGDKTEVIKDLRMSGDPSVDNLEYDITKALLNLTTETSRKVAFVGGFGGPADSPGFADSAKPVFEQLYGKLIEPVALDLSAEGATIAPDVSTVLLMNLDSPISAQAQFELDQHVQRGGSVGWFQSSAGIDEQITRQLQQQMGGGQGGEGGGLDIADRQRDILTATWNLMNERRDLEPRVLEDRAAVLAMRDAAALVILQMDKATGISALTEARRSSVAAKPPARLESAPAENLQTISQEDPRDDTG